MTNQPKQIETWQSRFDKIAPPFDWRGYPARSSVINFIASERRTLLREIKNKLVSTRARLDAAIASGRGNDEICDAFNDIDNLLAALKTLEENL